jgi:hypothetical protein
MSGIIHPVGPCFFPFQGGSGCWIFSVPNLFPWNFHSVFMKFASFQYVAQVSNVFPNLFPIALTLCHILCPQFYSCTLYKGAQRMRLQHIISVSGMFKSWFKNFCAELNKDVDQFFFFGAKYCKISTWKIWFQPIQRIFHEKKWPKFARFPIKKF